LRLLRIHSAKDVRIADMAGEDSQILSQRKPFSCMAFTMQANACGFAVGGFEACHDFSLSWA
jgi:hypothetical protein